MKKYLKVLMLFFSLTFLLIFSGCNTTKTVIKKDISNDKRVLEAIKVISEYWNDDYEKNKIEDKYLAIINTKIVNIKDNINSEQIFEKDDLFKDVDYIVEFELMSNYFGSAPYYSNAERNNCVVVYKDGTTKVNISPFLLYRTTTYSCDFSPIIESIEEFYNQYNRTIELE